MIIPEHLKYGDKIAIVCTARFAEYLEISYAVEWLKSWGLIPVYGQSIGLKHHQFGGTDTQRAKDLQKQINDPEIKAIWCAKGGYGTTRILDDIDFNPLKKQPKWIIGYSDITALHLHLQNLGLVSLHAQMPVDMQKKSDKTRESLQQSLFAKPFDINYKSEFSNVSGFCKGQIIGGNLSVLYSVLGSHSVPDFKNKILFIEDLDEYLYHIDRMMLSLKRQGLLNDISGIIVGSMTDMNDNNTPFGQTAQDIVAHYTNKLNIPVAYDCPVGHGFENLSLTLGLEIKLRVNKNEVSIEY